MYDRRGTILSLDLIYKETMSSFFTSCFAGASVDPTVSPSSSAIFCASYAP